MCRLPAQVEESLAYLGSQAAVASLRDDPYWPKWNSPWWHMVLLWEMGHARLIASHAPQALAEMVAALASPYYVRDFVKQAWELPAGKNLYRHVMCHCGLGTMYQVLGQAGVEVDREISWLRKRLVEDILPDGGLTCDGDAYFKDPAASSMVATVPVLEALLSIPDRTADEESVLEHGVEFLLRRELRLGSHDEEREDEADWLKPCFPRFYFYDVLRGLRFLAKWSRETGRLIPRVVPHDAIAHVVSALEREFPDGRVRALRSSTEGTGTIERVSGEWTRWRPASRFSLLDEVQRVGEVSPWLTQEWREVRAALGLNSRPN